MNIYLFPGVNGQELSFVYVNDPNGAETFVYIQNSPSSSGYLYLPNSATQIAMDEIGQSVKLQYIEDGWYIISNNNITLL